MIRHLLQYTLNITVLLMLIVCLSATASDHYLLLVPEDFDIKVVNGQAYSAPLFQRQRMQSIKLDPQRDKQQIVMTYSQVFDDGDDSAVVKSKAFMLEFVIDKSGVDEITLQFDAPKNYSQARLFAKKPVVKVFSSANAVLVKVRLSYDVQQKSWLSQFVAPAESAASVEDAKVVSLPVEEQVSVSPVSQLFYWWDMASEAERETFLRHVSKP